MSKHSHIQPRIEPAQALEIPSPVSRREFIDRLARIGLVAGTVGVSGVRAFGQSGPRPPSNVRIGTGSVSSSAVGFVPEPGFNVAGSFAEGASITVSRTGGGFGTKPNGPEPYFWFPYKTDFLNRGRGGQSGVPAYSRGYINSNNCPPNSTATWECDMAACNRETGPTPYYSSTPCSSTHNRWAPGEYLKFPAAPRHMYLAVKRNYAFDFSEKNSAWNAAHGGSLGMKDLRSQDAAITGHTVHSVNQMGGTSYGRTAYWYNGTAGVQGTQYEPQYKRAGVWLTTELTFQGNTPGVADGLYKLVEQGRLVHDPFPNQVGYNYGCMPNHRTVPVGGAPLQMWALDHLNSYHDPAVLSPMNVYVDYLYMDDSWCHVIVSDETDYQDITNLNPTGTGSPRGQNWTAAKDYLREPQIISAWSDTQITFSCRQGSHASLSGKYLYVMNDDGAVMKVGRFS